MAVVMKKQYGKCTATIDDSYIINNKTETDTILDNIYNIFLQSEYITAQSETSINHQTN